MADTDSKALLQNYLQDGRDAMLWKLDGLSEYDQRRPLTRTGTNLLGLVKHLAAVEGGYFTTCFDRPIPASLAWAELDLPPNADMWASADESAADIIEMYHTAWASTDATIAALDLDTRGTVPWWSEHNRHPTLEHVIVHMVAETHRHAGHADLVRELVDGAAGLNPAFPNLPPGDSAWWAQYRAELEAVAAATRG